MTSKVLSSSTVDHWPFTFLKSQKKKKKIAKLASGIGKRLSFSFSFFQVILRGFEDIHLLIWRAKRLGMVAGIMQTGLPGPHCTTEPAGEKQQPWGSGRTGFKFLVLTHQLGDLRSVYLAFLILDYLPHLLNSIIVPSSPCGYFAN